MGAGMGLDFVSLCLLIHFLLLSSKCKLLVQARLPNLLEFAVIWPCCAALLNWSDHFLYPHSTLYLWSFSLWDEQWPVQHRLAIFCTSQLSFGQVPKAFEVLAVKRNENKHAWQDDTCVEWTMFSMNWASASFGQKIWRNTPSGVGMSWTDLNFRWLSFSSVPVQCRSVENCRSENHHCSKTSAVVEDPRLCLQMSRQVWQWMKLKEMTRRTP